MTIAKASDRRLVRMMTWPPELGVYIERLSAHHRRLCPRQVLGVRMGLYAADLLGLDLPSDAKPALAIVETDGCFADGVSVTTGCRLGNRSLRLVDYGKVALTLLDLVTERAVRLRPNPLARQRALDYAPEAESRWQAQLVGYQRMPIDELVLAEMTRLAMPLAVLVGSPGERTTCAVCGEEVINLRQVIIGTESVCRGCVGERYYAADGAKGRRWTAQAA
jgi:formylmethanofuran dehydrogenase subunit E